MKADLNQCHLKDKNSESFPRKNGVKSKKSQRLSRRDRLMFLRALAGKGRN
jgi:hypothetical protein